MPKGQQITYSKNEMDFLKIHETTPRKELAKLFNDRFGREISCENIKHKCQRMGLKTGRTGCFDKGHIPMNKGTKGISGQHPNSRKTQFKKGIKPKNVHYIGHERLTPDGYIEISVAEKNPHTGHSRRYKLKHRHIWEQANGPIPKGNIIKFIDGDKTNCALENLTVITMAENAIINGQGLAMATGEALTSAIAYAKLKTAASQAQKQLEQ